VTGTLGILLKSKREGLINDVKPLIEKMIFENIYIAPSIITLCLKEAGE